MFIQRCMGIGVKITTVYLDGNDIGYRATATINVPAGGPRAHM